MDFFIRFAKLYNEVFHRSFIKTIPPSQEDWEDFEKKLSKYDNKEREFIYLSILHYYFLTTKKVENLPFGLKRKGNDILITYSNLPSALQHILILSSK